ncbi:MAG: pentapeptide repeat-containing protein [Paracoccaceae bacterium]
MLDEVQLRDKFGEVLKTYRVPHGRVQFEGVTWEGVHLHEAQLANTNFKGAALYWANFFLAYLDGVNFENANLQSVDLIEASCIGTSFRAANLGPDNLGGGSQLQGAVFTRAILNRANLEGAEYDEKTKFPKGFYPQSNGMIEIQVGE